MAADDQRVPLPEPRDAARTAAAVEAWLARKFSSGPVSVTDVGGPAHTGFSNETIFLRARWSEAGRDRSERLVIRVQPTSHTVFLEPQFRVQYDVMKVLKQSTDIPLPEIHWFEDDPSVLGSPFYVMERLDGLIPADLPPYTTEGWLHDATPEQQAQACWSGIEAMAKVHQVDWERLGLGYLDRRQRGDTGFAQQLDYYRESLEWAFGGRPGEIAGAAYQWLVDHRPSSEPAPVLVWGDARPANMIFSDFRCAAVLDWEMVALGPPEVDLSWWLFLDRHWTEGIGVAPLPGWPERAEVVATYEKWLGRPLQDLGYYEVFAGLRFAVIMARITNLGIGYGLFPPDTDMVTNNIPTHLLAGMLELAPPGPAIRL